jgi:drug/metabolite transporter (DMT)-like permease
MKQDAQNKLLAVSLMVFNCFCGATIPAVIKYTNNVYSNVSLMAGYYFIATVISVAHIYFSKQSFKSEVIPLHFFRSIITTSAYLLYFLGVSMTSLANAISVGHLDAILTCIFCYIFLKEALYKIDIVNLLLSFIGAMLILKPGGDVLNMGAALALISAILWAGSNVIIKIIARKDSTALQVFYSNFFTFLLCLSLSIYLEKVDEIMEVKAINWIIILAVLINLQNYALFKALNMTRVSVIMPFFAFAVIFGDIIGYSFFGESQDIYEIIGTSLVITVSIFQIISIRLGRV